MVRARARRRVRLPVQSPVECRTRADGSRELVSTVAENVGNTIGGPWKIRTTTLELQGNRLVVTGTTDEEARSR